MVRPQPAAWDTLGVGQMRNALEEESPPSEGLRLQDHDVDAIVYTFGTLIGTADATGAMFNLEHARP